LTSAFLAAGFLAAVFFAAGFLAVFVFMTIVPFSEPVCADTCGRAQETARDFFTLVANALVLKRNFPVEAIEKIDRYREELSFDKE